MNTKPQYEIDGATTAKYWGFVFGYSAAPRTAEVVERGLGHAGFVRRVFPSPTRGRMTAPSGISCSGKTLFWQLSCWMHDDVHNCWGHRRASLYEMIRPRRTGLPVFRHRLAMVSQGGDPLVVAAGVQRDASAHRSRKCLKYCNGAEVHSIEVLSCTHVPRGCEIARPLIRQAGAAEETLHRLAREPTVTNLSDRPTHDRRYLGRETCTCTCSGSLSRFDTADDLVERRQRPLFGRELPRGVGPTPPC